MDRIKKSKFNVNALKLQLQLNNSLIIATSGGVDSMTLAYFAHKEVSTDVTMFHATSSAVPLEATVRVQSYAKKYSWSLVCHDVGEFSDEDYRKNPIDRCFYCKKNLYGFIANKFPDHIICSGTNLDDLNDFRPGLVAAQEKKVIHPFVEAGLYKADVRGLAVYLGLNDLAVLPSAPCLSSRIETGIRIKPSELSMVEEVESMLRSNFNPTTARCRIRLNGLVIELDKATIAKLDSKKKKSILDKVMIVMERHNWNSALSIEPYKMGSAFNDNTKFSN